MFFILLSIYIYVLYAHKKLRNYKLFSLKKMYVHEIRWIICLTLEVFVLSFVWIEGIGKKRKKKFNFYIFFCLNKIRGEKREERKWKEEKFDNGEKQKSLYTINVKITCIPFMSYAKRKSKLMQWSNFIGREIFISLLYIQTMKNKFDFLSLFLLFNFSSIPLHN